MVGQRLLHYEIIEKLGEGGMGVVYRARDTHLDRFVAIKVLPPKQVADPSRKARFIQEAKAASALDHPNILHIYDIGQSGGIDFIAMEYVHGKTLGELIGHKGLQLGDALKYGAQIASGLAKAHAAGIVHRDLKPANVMVSEDGVVKLLDFGLAKLVERSEPDSKVATRTMAPHTREGAIVGTAAYMSPEQVEGKRVDARSDIFSFGALLYEMVTGQRAFPGDTWASTMAAVLKSEPKPPGQLSVLPKELDRIIARCLRKDVERRSQSVAEIKVALEELREESESGVQPVVVSSARRNRWWAVAAGCGAVAIAAAVWLALPSGQSPAPAYRVRQLTRDDASSSMPAISPDGKFVTYVSDRGGHGDLWLQQVAGGEPVRLTDTAPAEVRPKFSPDGSQILFRTSEGLFLISALGGAERQIATGPTFLSGWIASFSPDGKWIAYKSGAHYVEGNAIMLMPTTGGASRKLLESREALVGLAWSPDSGRLLVAVPEDLRTVWYGPYRWNLVSIADGSSVKVEGMHYLADAGVTEPAPIRWLSNGNRVILSSLEESNHVWQVHMTSSGHIAGPPARLTNGTGESPGDPSRDGSIIPFQTGATGTGIYALRLDVKRGATTGEPQKLTRGEGTATFPCVTPDGARLVFVSDRLGNPDLWMRDNRTGEEKIIVSSPHRGLRGFISPDGSRLSFQRIENAKIVSYWTFLAGGAENRICDDCRSLLGWTPDSQGVIVSTGKPEQMEVLQLATGARTLVAAHPRYDVHDVTISPDGQWFAAKLYEEPAKARIFVAPFKREGPTPESQWTWITDSGESYRPMWSPDGSMLYYFLGDAVRAQRLDPTSKRASGAPITVYRWDSSLRLPSGGQIGYGLAPDRLYLALRAGRSSVWVAEAETSK